MRQVIMIAALITACSPVDERCPVWPDDAEAIYVVATTLVSTTCATYSSLYSTRGREALHGSPEHWLPAESALTSGGHPACGIRDRGTRTCDERHFTTECDDGNWLIVTWDATDGDVYRGTIQRRTIRASDCTITERFIASRGGSRRAACLFVQIERDATFEEAEAACAQ